MENLCFFNISNRFLKHTLLHPFPPRKSVGSIGIWLFGLQKQLDALEDWGETLRLNSLWAHSDSPVLVLEHRNQC